MLKNIVALFVALQCSYAVADGVNVGIEVEMEESHLALQGQLEIDELDENEHDYEGELTLVDKATGKTRKARSVEVELKRKDGFWKLTFYAFLGRGMFLKAEGVDISLERVYSDGVTLEAEMFETIWIPGPIRDIMIDQLVDEGIMTLKLERLSN